MTKNIRVWSVWGVNDKRVDLGTTILVVLVLVWSRFAWLPSGPWEWDETLFARGMLHFELAAHFPHPPGFPGWLAIGHMLLPFAGQPLVALQWASAAFSILALWPLAVIGRRVAPPAVAAASAVVVLFFPGPWLFSVRGFSSTAAATLALFAAALWVGGLHGRRVTVFTLLIAIAFLVRPILLPALGILWVCGAYSVKRRNEALPGVVFAGSLIVIAVAVMVRLEGGWAVFLQSFSTHAGSHASRLHLNGGGLADLGIVKGVGGLGIAAACAVIATYGLWAWGRRIGRGALVSWLLIGSALIGPLLFLQNRTYARYAVPVQLAAAPLVAGAFGLLPAGPIALGLLAVAAGFGWWSFPLLEEQHETRLPAWSALVEAEKLASPSGWAVVVDPEVHPFASYRWHVLTAEGVIPPPLELSPRAPEGWAGIDRPWVVAAVHPHLYLPSATGRERAFELVSPRLERLSQQRFLQAVLIENPPLPVGQWWSRAQLDDGTPFMWAGPEAELWLPPVPEGAMVGVEFRPAPGDREVAVSLNGQDEVRISGDSGRRWVWFRRRGADVDRPVIVGLDRARGYAPGGNDQRPLSVQVFGVIVRPPGMAYGGPVAAPWQRQALRLVIDGAFGPETFGTHGSGTWLKPEARLRLEVEEPGDLTLVLRAPRPTDPRLVVRIGGVVVSENIDFVRGAADLSFEIGSEDIREGIVEITLSSEAFIASAMGAGTDTRQLGVVATGLRFRPSNPGVMCWWNPGNGHDL